MNTVIRPKLITFDQLGIFEDIFGADPGGRGINSVGDIVTRTADGRFALAGEG